MKKLSIMIAVLALTSACDKLCHRSVDDVVSVANQTGAAIDLTICKGREKKMVIHVSESETNIISLGSHDDGFVQGGADSLKSCRSDSGGNQSNYDIALAHESFALVKLCYNRANTDVTLVALASPCPTGLVAQEAEAICN